MRSFKTVLIFGLMLGVTGLSKAHGDEGSPSPVDRAKAISQRLQNSSLPSEPGEGEIRYFSGPCISIEGSMDSNALDWGLLAVTKRFGKINTVWSVTYTDDVEGKGSDPYRTMSFEDLAKFYPIQGRGPILDDGRWLVEVSETPKLFYRVGVEQSTGTWIVVGSHLGLVYCAMMPIVEGSR